MRKNKKIMFQNKLAAIALHLIQFRMICEAKTSISNLNYDMIVCTTWQPPVHFYSKRKYHETDVKFSKFEYLRLFSESKGEDVFGKVVKKLFSFSMSCSRWTIQIFFLGDRKKYSKVANDERKERKRKAEERTKGRLIKKRGWKRERYKKEKTIVEKRKTRSRKPRKKDCQLRD